MKSFKKILIILTGTIGLAWAADNSMSGMDMSNMDMSNTNMSNMKGMSSSAHSNTKHKQVKKHTASGTASQK